MYLEKQKLEKGDKLKKNKGKGKAKLKLEGDNVCINHIQYFDVLYILHFIFIAKSIFCLCG